MDYITRKGTHVPRHYIHIRDRRQTLLYKKKRKIAKLIWTVALIIMCLLLQLPGIAALSVVIAFLATFASFTVLDGIWDDPRKEINQCPLSLTGRVSAYEAEGCRFDSCGGCQSHKYLYETKRNI